MRQAEERPSELPIDAASPWGIQIEADFQHETVGDEAAGAYAIPVSKMQRFKEKVSTMIKKNAVE